MNCTFPSIIALYPFLRDIIASCESSALTSGKISKGEIESILNAQTEPSKMGVESIEDSPNLSVLNLLRKAGKGELPVIE